jgi:hypothetical protein
MGTIMVYVRDLSSGQVDDAFLARLLYLDEIDS